MVVVDSFWLAINTNHKILILREEMQLLSHPELMLLTYMNHIHKTIFCNALAAE